MSMLKLYLNYTDSEQVQSKITDAKEITIQFGSETSNNQLDVTVKNNPINVFSDGSIQQRWIDTDTTCRFRVIKATKGDIINDEIIDVYADYTDTDPITSVFSTDFLLFSGVIQKGSVKYSNKDENIKLNCADRSSIMLSKLAIPQAFRETETLNTCKIQQRIIRGASDNVPSDSKSFNSTGVESIGTGSYLIDARLFSESLKTTGSTTSSTTNKLIDVGGAFDSFDLQKGDWVRNSIDDTYAYIVSVDSATTITLTKDIFSTGDSYEVSNGFIQDKRTDGTSFPTLSFSQIDKPITNSIDELSQLESTNSAAELASTGTIVIQRGARWFIDKRNRYHWYIPDDSPEYYMEVGVDDAISPDTVGHKIIESNINNEVRTNVNFLIYKAGEDMNNNQVRGFLRAQFSGAPTERDSKRDWSNSIAIYMKDQDLKAGNITKGTGQIYNYPVSYPMTPSWDTQGRSVADDNAYNTNFIEEAVRKAEGRCRAEFQKSANPRWAGTVKIRGEDIRPGDLINFTDKKHGVRDILVRVQSTTQNISSQGWFTSLTVQEDELEQTQV